MRRLMLAVVAMSGLAMFGSSNTAEANHYCGGYGWGGGYYQPHYGYGSYPVYYGYSRPYYGHSHYGHHHHHGGWYGGSRVVVRSPNFSFRYRW